MKPKNFPGRKWRRKQRLLSKGVHVSPEVADMKYKIGAKNRDTHTGQYK